MFKLKIMQHFSSLADLHRFNNLPMPENPLFSVYRCPKNTSLGEKPFTSDFYIIGLKKLTSGIIMYGRTKYDHDNGCMLFAKPRQIIEFKTWNTMKILSLFLFMKIF